MTHMIDIASVDAVPTTFQATAYRTAKISEFREPAPKLLFGERLKCVTALEASIERYGLMRPLTVTRSGNKLIVIDGRKRLNALRRLRFKNALPRSLVNIPFVLSTEPVPHILSAQDQYREMIIIKSSDEAPQSIEAALCISPERLHALQSIDRLSPRLKQAFLDDTISLDQAQAYAALPWHEAQDSLLLSLGPFASAPAILKAIDERQKTTRSLPTAMDTHTADPSNIIFVPVPPLEGLTADAFSSEALLAA